MTFRKLLISKNGEMSAAKELTIATLGFSRFRRWSIPGLGFILPLWGLVLAASGGSFLEGRGRAVWRQSFGDFPAPVERMPGYCGASVEDGVSGSAWTFHRGEWTELDGVEQWPSARGTVSMWLRLHRDAGMGRSPICLLEAVGEDEGEGGFRLDWFPQRFLRVTLNNPRRTELYVRSPELFETGDWNQLVLTWDMAKGASLYFAGTPVDLGWTPPWEPGSIVSVGIGAMIDGTTEASEERGIGFDEIEVFDRELRPEEIAARAERFRPIPLRVQLLDPYVWAKESTELEWVVTNPGGKERALQAVSICGVNADGVEIAVDRLDEVLVAAGGAAQIATPMPSLEPGRYTVTLEFSDTSGPRRESRELTVLEPGSAEASEEVLEFVAELDASRVEPLAQEGETRVRHAAIGDYREAGSNRFDRFALDFEVEEVDQPHVAEIRYPDDRPRTMEVMLQDFGDPIDFQAHTGIFTGDEYPLSGEMKTHRILFWPRTRRQAFIFMTAEEDYPAAVAGIRVSRLTQMKMETPQDRFEGEVPARSLGLYYEDPVLFHSFGTGRDGPGFVEAADRLVSYMRSFGQTEFEYPLAWYSGPIYGTTVEPFEPDVNGAQGGVRPHPAGFPEYLLKRFAENGIKFTAGLHLHTLPSLHQMARTDWDHIPAKEDMVINVTAEGKLWYGHWHGADPSYNAADPRVMGAVDAVVDEILARYGEEPAFGGISLVIARPKIFSFGSLRSGYNDSNLARFQRETGLTIDGYEVGDPARFEKAYAWIMADPGRKESWIDWRCRVLHEQYAAMGERVAKTRSGLKLMLDVFVHPTLSERLADYLREDPVTAMREMGIDPKLYEGDPHIVLNATLVPADLRWARNHDYDSPEPVFRTAMTAPEVSGVLQPGGQVVRTTIHDRYFESAIGREKPLQGLSDLGVEEMVWRASTFNPAGSLALEPYALALAYLDATSIVKGGYVLGTLGMESELSRFAASFQALPAVPFEDLGGVPDLVRARWRKVEGRSYLYVVNTLPVALSGEIAFAEEREIRELGVGTASEAVKELAFDLPPFGLRSFVIDVSSEAAIAVDVSAPSEWEASLEARWREVRAAARIHPEAVGRFEPYLRFAESLWNEHRLGRLYYLLEEYWVLEILNSVPQGEKE